MLQQPKHSNRNLNNKLTEKIKNINKQVKQDLDTVKERDPAAKTYLE
ncbi:MAG: hypothetical protein LBL93_00505, partial [Ruminococcus sp.]|nr:hypothetical protein [Ruminococcus sp.]